MESGKYCQEFLNAIRLEFKFLFELYGFVPLVCSEARQGEYCLVVLRSGRCQVKFRLEQGTPEYFFGTIQASPDWDDKGEWYPGDLIVAYLIKRRPELAVPWPTEKREWSTEEILHIFAARLRPVADEIISAFASNLAADWWKAFRQDFDERIAKVKDQIARG